MQTGRLRLRTSLLLLCAAAILPIAMLAALAGVWVLSQERDRLVRTAQERNRAAMAAVDAELSGTIDALRMLTHSRNLLSENFEAFHAEAVDALATQSHWSNIVLTDPSGRQRVNARLSWGTPLLLTPVAPRTIEQVFATGQPAVDGLAPAPKLSNELGIPVRVPVIRDGHVAYVLTAVLRPDRLQRLLLNQRVPAEWVSGLVDGNGRIVARVPSVATGTMASPDYLQRSASAQEGWYRGRTLEDRDTFTAFYRSPMTGWSIGYALPAEAVLGGMWRLAWLLGGGLMLSVVAGVGISLWLGRKVSEPIARLAADAAGLPKGRPPTALSSPIREVVLLGDALQNASRTIREARDDLSHIVRIAPIGILIAHDAEADLVTGNDYARGLIDASPGSGTDAPFSLAMRLDDKLCRAEELLRRTAATGQGVLDRLVTVDGSNGKTIELIVNVVPLPGDDGRPRGAIATLQDVTSLRSMEAELAVSEARLRLAVEGAELGLWETDLSTGLTTCSDHNLQLFGLPKTIGALSPDDWLAVIHPDDHAKVLEAWKQALPGSQPYQLEYRIRRPDGEERWVESRARFRVDSAGRPLKAFGVSIDVTGRKHAEEAVRDDSRRKDEFIAILAHELRNPLAPIRYATRLFRRTTPPDMLEDAARMVERQLTHMSRLLDDLLDVSRVTRGALELERQSLDLSRLAETAVADAQALADRASRRLQMRLSDLALPILGDSTRLLQIIGNLINNAIKYTEPDGRIVVSTMLRDGHAVLEVSDDGIGIAPELLPRVFDLFTRGEHSAAKVAGLGIGLALANRLALLHGGRLSVLSEGIGHGSSFLLELPLARSASLITQSVAAPERVTVLKAAGTRVLVVDDNADGATTLQVLLEQVGYETKTAFDGASAIEVAEVFRPHIVLLDIGLPDVSGHEVARKLRLFHWGHRPFIIAVTGWGLNRDRLMTTEAGCDEHLIKPVDPEQLLALLSHGRQEAVG